MTDVNFSVWPDFINKHHNSLMCLYLDILQTVFVRRFREKRLRDYLHATTTTNTSVNQMTKLSSTNHHLRTSANIITCRDIVFEGFFPPFCLYLYLYIPFGFMYRRQFLVSHEISVNPFIDYTCLVHCCWNGGDSFISHCNAEKINLFKALLKTVLVFFLQPSKNYRRFLSYLSQFAEMTQHFKTFFMLFAKKISTLEWNSAEKLLYIKFTLCNNFT